MGRAWLWKVILIQEKGNFVYHGNPVGTNLQMASVRKWNLNLKTDQLDALLMDGWVGVFLLHECSKADPDPKKSDSENLLIFRVHSGIGCSFEMVVGQH